MNTAVNLAVRTAAKIVRQNFTGLGLDLPDEFTADLDAIDQMLGRRDTIRHDRHDLAYAVADVLAAGKDPATDKTVAAHLARAQLSAVNIAEALDAVALDRRAATMIRHAPTFIDRLATVVEAADRTLADAHAAIPSLDLTGPHFASTLPTSKLALYGQARDAVDQLGRVVQTWSALAAAVGTPAPARNLRPLIIANLDADQLDKLGSRDPLAPAIAGHRLDLATYDTIATRTDKVRKQQQARTRSAPKPNPKRRNTITVVDLV